eukprot:scaffold38004_cov166-Skeletonema_marinoi.AAC.2
MTSSYSEHWKVAVAAPSQSIPISGIISRFSQSELEDLAQAELLADYRDGQMYERIMTGILRRCNMTGTYHPKTMNSLNNIIHTKMQDYGSLSEDRSCHADEDLIVTGEKYEPIHSTTARTELTGQREASTLMCSSVALERETLYSSMSPLSCFSTAPGSIESDSESQAGHYVENGIFEFEL